MWFYLKIVNLFEGNQFYQEQSFPYIAVSLHPEMKLRILILIAVN
jgi:hypothetical protein